MTCDTYCDNHGCPAGGLCHGLPGCKDTACPGHPGARVARVGRRMHGPEPLRGSLWRLYLRRVARVMLLALIATIVSAASITLVAIGNGVLA